MVDNSRALAYSLTLDKCKAMPKIYPRPRSPSGRIYFLDKFVFVSHLVLEFLVVIIIDVTLFVVRILVVAFLIVVILDVAIIVEDIRS